MATTQRDYYEVLGVSRAADDAEIKRAFRRLARELHPDVSEAADSQERFREVVEAYEVLSKRETRELYDRFGHAGLRGGGFTPTQFDFGSLTDLFSAFFGDDLFGVGARSTRSRGADLGVLVEIELAEAATGIKREVPFPVAVTCSACGGSGAAPGTSPVTCATCGGAGRLQQVSRSAFGEFVRTQSCPEWRGAGRRLEEHCPGRDAARRGPGAARARDARDAGIRPRRPSRAGQRRRATPSNRRAAAPARGVRPLDGRRDVPCGRRVLREAEERVSLSGLRRVS